MLLFDFMAFCIKFKRWQKKEVKSRKRSTFTIWWSNNEFDMHFVACELENSWIFIFCCWVVWNFEFCVPLCPVLIFVEPPKPVREHRNNKSHPNQNTFEAIIPKLSSSLFTLFIIFSFLAPLVLCESNEKFALQKKESNTYTK